VTFGPNCIRTGMIPRMANTPNRMVRIPDPLWTRFGRMCTARGTTRTAQLIACMERQLKAYERQHGPLSEPPAHDEPASE
jgi:hypothetical protein